MYIIEKDRKVRAAEVTERERNGTDATTGRLSRPKRIELIRKNE
jgi:hypothetical protein